MMKRFHDQSHQRLKLVQFGSVRLGYKNFGVKRCFGDNLLYAAV